MIAQLHGSIVLTSPPWVLLTIQGTGISLEVEMPLHSSLRLAAGQSVTLYTQFLWRNEQPVLVGFWTAEEKMLFQKLLRVNGIGSKLALNIIDRLPPQAFWHAITTQDAATLCSVKGLGKKLAERLIIELREQANVVRYSPVQQTIFEALEQLGFTPAEAALRLSAIGNEGDLAELLQKALKMTPPHLRSQDGS